MCVCVHARACVRACCVTRQQKFEKADGVGNDMASVGLFCVRKRCERERGGVERVIGASSERCILFPCLPACLCLACQEYFRGGCKGG